MTGNTQNGRAGRLRHLLQALVTLVALAALAAAALWLIQARAEAMDDAEMRARQSAQLLKAHTIRILRATDFVLEETARYALRTPPDRLAERQAWEKLKDLATGLPESGGVFIAGADGWLKAGTSSFPIIPTDVNDRTYFQAVRDDGAERFIGPTVRLKHFDRHAFHVSRRMVDHESRFAGAVIASINSDTFTDFYNTLALGRRASLGIVRPGGAIVLRQPEPESWAGRSMAGCPVLDAFNEGDSGLVRAQCSLDDVERVVAWQMIAEWDVIVFAGIAVDDVLAPWWRNVWVALSALGAGGLALGGLAAFAFRSLAREERMMAGLEIAIRDRTEEALASAAEARAANESKTRFLAAASHDLRQPMQAAGMFVEALAVRLADTPNAPVVDKLRQSIDSTQALLTMLLDVSTLEAGRVEPSVADLRLGPLIAGLLDQMGPQAADKGLTLKSVPTQAVVRSDALLLERILRNLLVNAVRYTERGGILVGCRRRGDRLAILVVDTGPGIPDDKLAEIFDDFTRLGHKGGQGGLGLGLGVVRRMAHLLGHEIVIKSSPGRGSCFGVVVPLACHTNRPMN